MAFGNWTTAVRIRNDASFPPHIEQYLSTLLAFKLPHFLLDIHTVFFLSSCSANKFSFETRKDLPPAVLTRFYSLYGNGPRPILFSRTKILSK
ncbi:hypothetical protein K439DRAFT_96678 [Ramaria rubella]|nr:hypothetical protein K439DRAFT_96678 [Ramaria rubella]